MQMRTIGQLTQQVIIQPDTTLLKKHICIVILSSHTPRTNTSHIICVTKQKYLSRALTNAYIKDNTDPQLELNFPKPDSS